MRTGKLHVFVYIFMIVCLNACSGTPQTTPVQTAVATDSPEAATATMAPTLEPTDTPEPTATEEPTVEPSPTIEPTSESAKMEALIEQLKEEGTISTVEGTYHRLADFQQEWAQLYYYQWWYTDYSPSNFVIQADVEWETASKSANLGDSGCGFVYHTDDNQNHHATFLMMDGKVQTYRALSGYFDQMKGGYAGKFKVPSDKAHIILAVDQQTITVIINDKEVVHFQDTKLSGGKLGLTLASGTNKDFGTRCSMTNVELWELPE